ncbi:hypothetical protein D3C85_1511740 [compost metagenome]
MTTASVSLPPLAEVTVTWAGGIEVRRKALLLAWVSPASSPRLTPLLVALAARVGAAVSSLELAAMVSTPEATLKVALLMVT